MELGLQGRRAIVTGASSGLGRAIARRLALEGVHVVGVARRAALVEELSEEVLREGGSAITCLPADLSVPDASADVAREAASLLGAPADILMNVAGASRPVALDDPIAVWSAAMDIGFLAHVQLTHSVLPGMRERGWGRVVTVTGTSEPRFVSAASPPKAGLHMWSKAISRQIAADGVTINCIQPGKIRSEQIMRKLPTPEIERDYASREIPMKRIGEADEIASAALFLASTHAAYITGIVLPVDGGFRYFAY